MVTPRSCSRSPIPAQIVVDILEDADDQGKPPLAVPFPSTTRVGCALGVDGCE